MKIARILQVLAYTCTTMALVACTPKADSSPGSAAPAATASAPASAASAALPTVTVSTVKAQKRDVPVLLKGTGTVTPLTSVDLRAQTSSTISKVHFKDGDFVRAGQLLFTLDARTEEANLAKAKAQLAKSNATLADAKRQLERSQQLFGQNFVSQGAVDSALAQVESITASVAADQAALDAVKVSLSYSRVLAPLSGRAGSVNVSAGSAVAVNTTSLVTITQLDPIGVAFSIPQRNLADALAALKAGGAEVTATLPDGGGAFSGRLQFVDNQVDASAGTVRAKAIFANKDSKLWPGAFVNVAQTVTVLKDAVVVPQATIVQSARGSIVYVVQGGKATLKPVKLIYADGGDAVVTGVEAGDVVVLDGKQNTRPNSPVQDRAKEGSKEAGKAPGNKPGNKPGNALSEDATAALPAGAASGQAAKP